MYKGGCEALVRGYSTAVRLSFKQGAQRMKVVDGAWFEFKVMLLVCC